MVGFGTATGGDITAINPLLFEWSLRIAKIILVLYSIRFSVQLIVVLCERFRDLQFVSQYQVLGRKYFSEAQLYICISQKQLKKGRPAQSFFFFAHESF